MITAKIFRNKSGDIYGFKINNHGDPIVCAAISALAINTINSIEAFTLQDFICDLDDKEGYLSLEIPSVKKGIKDTECCLLLNSMLLGLNSVELENKNDIHIIDEEVRSC